MATIAARPMTSAAPRPAARPTARLCTHSRRQHGTASARRRHRPCAGGTRRGLTGSPSHRRPPLPPPRRPIARLTHARKARCHPLQQATDTAPRRPARHRVHRRPSLPLAAVRTRAARQPATTLPMAARELTRARKAPTAAAQAAHMTHRPMPTAARRTAPEAARMAAAARVLVCAMTYVDCCLSVSLCFSLSVSLSLFFSISFSVFFVPCYS
jgi:hypothetical protein